MFETFYPTGYRKSCLRLSIRSVTLEEGGVLVVEGRLYKVRGKDLAKEHQEKARAISEGGEKYRQDG